MLYSYRCPSLNSHSFCPHLLVFLWSISEQDTLGLHVPVQHPLKRRHVTLDHVFHLPDGEERQVDLMKEVDNNRGTQKAPKHQFVCYQLHSGFFVLACILKKVKPAFSGSCASTSFFNLRNRKGRSTLWRRRIIKMVSSSFRSTWRVKEGDVWQERHCTFWLMSSLKDSQEEVLHTFSPVMAKGALNHCSKVLQLLKMVGRRKLSSAQSSGSLFCSGVPVSRTRRGAR